MEHKFRGKADLGNQIIETEHLIIQDGDWVYGSLIDNEHTPYIVGSVVEADEEYIIPEFWVPVDRETVGQYTTLPAKNNAETYRGDIARESYNNPMTGEEVVFTWEVVFKNGEYWLKEVHGRVEFDVPLNMRNSRIELIGNVWDNPELVEANNHADQN